MENSRKVVVSYLYLSLQVLRVRVGLVFPIGTVVKRYAQETDHCYTGDIRTLTFSRGIISQHKDVERF